MRASPPGFRLLLLADTHLGFDEPVRPRTRRRRRGPEFFASFRRVLNDAVDQQVDLVVHGGDLFFRSKVPDAIVDRVYAELLAFAGHGIPLAIVPGNHERSRLPASLFLEHPGIHIFDEPRTFEFELGGARVALGGFPNVRRNIREDFVSLVDATGVTGKPADVRLLCTHQTVEGARVGPAGYTFRSGHDVIRRRDLPASCDAVLAGHIHRHQVLEVPHDGRPPLPVIYPGSTQRTSFAEADESKGYSSLVFCAGSGGAWSLARHEFVELPTRPMVTVDVPGDLPPAAVGAFLDGVVREAPAEAIVRFRAANQISPALAAAFSAGRVAERLPPTMNVQFGAGFFERRTTRRRIAEREP